jgi:hypothetical protein
MYTQAGWSRHGGQGGWSLVASLLVLWCLILVGAVVFFGLLWTPKLQTAVPIATQATQACVRHDGVAQVDGWGGVAVCRDGTAHTVG